LRWVEIRALTFDIDQSLPEAPQSHDVTSVTAIGRNRFVTGNATGAGNMWEIGSSSTLRAVLPWRELYSADLLVTRRSVSDDANVIAMLLYNQDSTRRLRVVKCSPPTVLLEKILSATRGFTGPKLSPNRSTVMTFTRWKRKSTVHMFDLDLGVDARVSPIIASSSPVFSPDGKPLATFSSSSLHTQHQHYSWEPQYGDDDDEYWIDQCAVAGFSPDMTQIIHLFCGRGRVTVMDVEYGIMRCFDRDPAPLLKGVLVQNPTTGWVYHGVGKRLWWIPPPAPVFQ
jgi:hypothetical protein